MYTRQQLQRNPSSQLTSVPYIFMLSSRVFFRTHSMLRAVSRSSMDSQKFDTQPVTRFVGVNAAIRRPRVSACSYEQRNQAPPIRRLYANRSSHRKSHASHMTININFALMNPHCAITTPRSYRPI